MCGNDPAIIVEEGRCEAIRDVRGVLIRLWGILLRALLIQFCAATLSAQINELSRTDPAEVSSKMDPGFPSGMGVFADSNKANTLTASIPRTLQPLELPRETSFIPTDSAERGDAYVSLPSVPRPGFQLRKALRQEFEYLTVEHGFRLMQDKALRSQLMHGPFLHNWITSFQGYDLKRWGDGDNFLVNGIAHPMQGAIAGWIFLQNSPTGSTRVIGRDPQYWTSRLKAMGWAAAYEVQWKIGPLSETSIGNAGGWSYVPDCGIVPRCVNNPSYPPPTNNTGLSDWIVTPVAGMGWIMAEDAIDKYVVNTIGERNHMVGVILRSALEPTRNFAALFNGVAPWDRRYAERRFIHSTSKLGTFIPGDDSWKKNRRSVGFVFANISLPGERGVCVQCRKNHAGFGVPYGTRILEHLYFDSEVNHFAESSGGPTWQGLFGAKFGQQQEKWGLFAKVRPGLIHYKKAWSGGPKAHFTDLNRFALDVGSAIEFYPNRHSALRVDLGTTLVRYLQDYPTPRISPLGSLISTDYYVTQGNFQVAAGYRIRF